QLQRFVKHREVFRVFLRIRSRQAADGKSLVSAWLERKIGWINVITGVERRQLTITLAQKFLLHVGHIENSIDAPLFDSLQFTRMVPTHFARPDSGQAARLGLLSHAAPDKPPVAQGQRKSFKFLRQLAPLRVTDA